MLCSFSLRDGARVRNKLEYLEAGLQNQAGHVVNIPPIIQHLNGSETGLENIKEREARWGT